MQNKQYCGLKLQRNERGTKLTHMHEITTDPLTLTTHDSPRWGIQICCSQNLLCGSNSTPRANSDRLLEDGRLAFLTAVLLCRMGWGKTMTKDRPTWFTPVLPTSSVNEKTMKYWSMTARLI
jgi:hypothetical protein